MECWGWGPLFMFCITTPLALRGRWGPVKFLEWPIEGCKRLSGKHRNGSKWAVLMLGSEQFKNGTNRSIWVRAKVTPAMTLLKSKIRLQKVCSRSLFSLKSPGFACTFFLVTGTWNSKTKWSAALINFFAGEPHLVLQDVVEAIWVRAWSTRRLAIAGRWTT